MVDGGHSLPPPIMLRRLLQSCTTLRLQCRPLRHQNLLHPQRQYAVINANVLQRSNARQPVLAIRLSSARLLSSTTKSCSSSTDGESYSVLPRAGESVQSTSVATDSVDDSEDAREFASLLEEQRQLHQLVSDQGIDAEQQEAADYVDIDDDDAEQDDQYDDDDGEYDDDDGEYDDDDGEYDDDAEQQDYDDTDGTQQFDGTQEQPRRRQRPMIDMEYDTRPDWPTSQELESMMAGPLSRYFTPEQIGEYRKQLFNVTFTARQLTLAKHIFTSSSASFVTSAPTLETVPEALGVELCFCGRSNVGKSSLMNAVFGGSKQLVKTSSTPV
jgi:predicted GTPase